MSALDDLRTRLAELADLGAIGQLLGWDQLTMMPPAAGPARASQMGTLSRLAHERATDPAIGDWLDAVEASGALLDPVDADLVRVARRDFERQRAIPADLAVELAEAEATGQEIWQKARAADDFAAFAPALRHNVSLVRALAACFPEAALPYDALLPDYDHGLTAARIAEVFGPLAESLAPMLADAAGRPAPAPLELTRAEQEAAVTAGLGFGGVEESSWRLDVSAHPFSTSIGAGDARITTRYSDGETEAYSSAMHEFGHSLYENQIAAELRRTNLASGTSMSVHESQSKLWENHVARHPAFVDAVTRQMAAAGHPVDVAAFNARLNAVRPSPIRVSADEVTYPLHVVLRFDLEVALVDGTLDVADLPAAWNDGMRRLLGVEVASDADGVLQDVHWSAGAFGYFPSYALGCLIAAQLWESLEQDIGDQTAALAAGDVGAIRDWLATHVHAHGRRLDTEPLVVSATGRPLESAPFLRRASAVLARG